MALEGTGATAATPSVPLREDAIPADAPVDTEAAGVNAASSVEADGGADTDNQAVEAAVAAEAANIVETGQTLTTVPAEADVFETSPPGSAEEDASLPAMADAFETGTIVANEHGAPEARTWLLEAEAERLGEFDEMLRVLSHGRYAYNAEDVAAHNGELNLYDLGGIRTRHSETEVQVELLRREGDPSSARMHAILSLSEATYTHDSEGAPSPETRVGDRLVVRLPEGEALATLEAQLADPESADAAAESLLHAVSYGIMEPTRAEQLLRAAAGASDDPQLIEAHRFMERAAAAETLDGSRGIATQGAVAWSAARAAQTLATDSDSIRLLRDLAREAPELVFTALRPQITGSSPAEPLAIRLLEELPDDVIAGEEAQALRRALSERGLYMTFNDQLGYAARWGDAELGALRAELQERPEETLTMLAENWDLFVSDGDTQRPTALQSTITGMVQSTVRSGDADMLRRGAFALGEPPWDPQRVEALQRNPSDSTTFATFAEIVDVLNEADRAHIATVWTAELGDDPARNREVAQLLLPLSDELSTATVERMVELATASGEAGAPLLEPEQARRMVVRHAAANPSELLRYDGMLETLGVSPDDRARLLAVAAGLVPSAGFVDPSADATATLQGAQLGRSLELTLAQRGISAPYHAIEAINAHGDYDTARLQGDMAALRALSTLPNELRAPLLDADSEELVQLSGAQFVEMAGNAADRDRFLRYAASLEGFDGRLHDALRAADHEVREADARAEAALADVERVAGRLFSNAYGTVRLGGPDLRGVDWFLENMPWNENLTEAEETELVAELRAATEHLEAARGDSSYEVEGRSVPGLGQALRDAALLRAAATAGDFEWRMNSGLGAAEVAYEHARRLGPDALPADMRAYLEGEGWDQLRAAYPERFRLESPPGLLVGADAAPEVSTDGANSIDQALELATDGGSEERQLALDAIITSPDVARVLTATGQIAEAAHIIDRIGADHPDVTIYDSLVDELQSRARDIRGLTGDPELAAGIERVRAQLADVPEDHPLYEELQQIEEAFTLYESVAQNAHALTEPLLEEHFRADDLAGWTRTNGPALAGAIVGAVAATAAATAAAPFTGGGSYALLGTLMVGAMGGSAGAIVGSEVARELTRDSRHWGDGSDSRMRLMLEGELGVVDGGLSYGREWLIGTGLQALGMGIGRGVGSEVHRQMVRIAERRLATNPAMAERLMETAARYQAAANNPMALSNLSREIATEFPQEIVSELTAAGLIQLMGGAEAGIEGAVIGGIIGGLARTTQWQTAELQAFRNTGVTVTEPGMDVGEAQSRLVALGFRTEHEFHGGDGQLIGFLARSDLGLPVVMGSDPEIAALAEARLSETPFGSATEMTRARGRIAENVRAMVERAHPELWSHPENADLQAAQATAAEAYAAQVDIWNRLQDGRGEGETLDATDFPGARAESPQALIAALGRSGLHVVSEAAQPHGDATDGIDEAPRVEGARVAALGGAGLDVEATEQAALDGASRHREYENAIHEAIEGAGDARQQAVERIVALNQADLDTDEQRLMMLDAVVGGNVPAAEIGAVVRTAREAGFLGELSPSERLPEQIGALFQVRDIDTLRAGLRVLAATAPSPVSDELDPFALVVRETQGVESVLEATIQTHRVLNGLTLVRHGRRDANVFDVTGNELSTQLDTSHIEVLSDLGVEPTAAATIARSQDAAELNQLLSDETYQDGIRALAAAGHSEALLRLVTETTSAPAAVRTAAGHLRAGTLDGDTIHTIVQAWAQIRQQPGVASTLTDFPSDDENDQDFRRRVPAEVIETLGEDVAWDLFTRYRDERDTLRGMVDVVLAMRHADAEREFSTDVVHAATTLTVDGLGVGVIGQLPDAAITEAAASLSSIRENPARPVEGGTETQVDRILRLAPESTHAQLRQYLRPPVARQTMSDFRASLAQTEAGRSFLRQQREARIVHSALLDLEQWAVSERQAGRHPDATTAIQRYRDGYQRGIDDWNRVLQRAVGGVRADGRPRDETQFGQQALLERFGDDPEAVREFQRLRTRALYGDDPLELMLTSPRNPPGLEGAPPATFDALVESLRPYAVRIRSGTSSPYARNLGFASGQTASLTPALFPPQREPDPDGHRQITIDPEAFRGVLSTTEHEDDHVRRGFVAYRSIGRYGEPGAAYNLMGETLASLDAFYAETPERYHAIMNEPGRLTRHVDEIRRRYAAFAPGYFGVERPREAALVNAVVSRIGAASEGPRDPSENFVDVLLAPNASGMLGDFDSIDPGPSQRRDNVLRVFGAQRLESFRRAGIAPDALADAVEHHGWGAETAEIALRLNREADYPLRNLTRLAPGDVHQIATNLLDRTIPAPSAEGSQRFFSPEQLRVLAEYPDALEVIDFDQLQIGTPPAIEPRVLRALGGSTVLRHMLADPESNTIAPATIGALSTQRLERLRELAEHISSTQGNEAFDATGIDDLVRYATIDDLDRIATLSSTGLDLSVVVSLGHEALPNLVQIAAGSTSRQLVEDTRNMLALHAHARPQDNGDAPSHFEAWLSRVSGSIDPPRAMFDLRSAEGLREHLSELGYTRALLGQLSDPEMETVATEFANLRGDGPTALLFGDFALKMREDFGELGERVVAETQSVLERQRLRGLGVPDPVVDGLDPGQLRSIRQLQLAEVLELPDAQLEALREDIGRLSGGSDVLEALETTPLNPSRVDWSARDNLTDALTLMGVDPSVMNNVREEVLLSVFSAYRGELTLEQAEDLRREWAAEGRPEDVVSFDALLPDGFGDASASEGPRITTQSPRPVTGEEPPDGTGGGRPAAIGDGEPPDGPANDNRAPAAEGDPSADTALPDLANLRSGLEDMVSGPFPLSGDALRTLGENRVDALERAGVATERLVRAIAQQDWTQSTADMALRLHREFDYPLTHITRLSTREVRGLLAVFDPSTAPAEDGPPFIANPAPLAANASAEDRLSASPPARRGRLEEFGSEQLRALAEHPDALEVIDTDPRTYAGSPSALQPQVLRALGKSRPLRRMLSNPGRGTVSPREVGHLSESRLAELRDVAERINSSQGEASFDSRIGRLALRANSSELERIGELSESGLHPSVITSLGLNGLPTLARIAEPPNAPELIEDVRQLLALNREAPMRLMARSATDPFQSAPDRFEHWLEGLGLSTEQTTQPASLRGRLEALGYSPLTLNRLSDQELTGLRDATASVRNSGVNGALFAEAALNIDGQIPRHSSRLIAEMRALFERQQLRTLGVPAEIVQSLDFNALTSIRRLQLASAMALADPQLEALRRDVAALDDDSRVLDAIDAAPLDPNLIEWTSPDVATDALALLGLDPDRIVAAPRDALGYVLAAHRGSEEGLDALSEFRRELVEEGRETDVRAIDALLPAANERPSPQATEVARDLARRLRGIPSAAPVQFVATVLDGHFGERELTDVEYDQLIRALQLPAPGPELSNDEIARVEDLLEQRSVLHTLRRSGVPERVLGLVNGAELDRVNDLADLADADLEAIYRQIMGYAGPEASRAERNRIHQALLAFAPARRPQLSEIAAEIQRDPN